jgi:hypothetical protein
MELTLTRRSLFRTGALASAATLVGLRPWAPAPAAAAPGHLRRSSYAGLLRETVRVGSVDLRLDSVADVAGAAVDQSLAGIEDAFVLTFSGPLEAALEGDIHTVRHPALGTFELFVSAVERPGSDRRYEAVIDRSVGAPRSSRGRAVAAAAAAGPAAPAASTRTRMVRRIALRRAASGARADILLAATADAERVYGRLAHRGKTIAVAAHDVRGQRTVLRFRGRPLRPGTYTVTLVFVNSAGVTSVRRRRVTLA